MFIKLKDLELDKVVFEERFPPGAVDLGDVRQKEPLKASGQAELIREIRGPREIVNDIRLVGSFSTVVAGECDRCLEPVEHAVGESFDLLYRPRGADATREDASIGLAETEIGYYHGDGILLEDVLKEQILLALPAKQVCGPDCKGLCPHCGSNLNVESCDCVDVVIDRRWTALEDIRKKLER